MSGKNHYDPVQITPDPERLYLYHRQQLSAMLDGELVPDEARFMLRRLQHDAELASCWERWQVCGDVLRGRAEDLLPADFAQRVARAIQFPGTTTAATARAPITRRRWHWHGAVLAASFAALAVWVVVRDPPSPDAVNVADTANRAVADAAAAVKAAPAARAFAAETTAAPARSAGAAELVRARARNAPPAAAMPSPATALADAAAGTPMPPADLLAPARQAPLTPRPWPRPLLPGAATGAARAMVGYGVPGGAPSPSLSPLDAFQPRWPESVPSGWHPPPPLLTKDAAMQAAGKRHDP